MSLREESNSSRLFPMQDGPPLPWSVAEALYENTYFVIYGYDQSLQRLAERGGGAYDEIAHCWRHLSAEQKARARAEMADLR